MKGDELLMKSKKNVWEQINKRTFFPPAILLLVILIIGVVMPDTLGTALNIVFAWLTNNLGWFYSLGTTLLVFIALYVGLGPYGKIKFGGKDAKPEMSTAKWFFVVMTSGMAAGVCYYAVAEPLDFFMNPPVFSGASGGSELAAEQALRYVFLHWTLHPYALYIIVSVAVGFMYWNCKKPFSVASGLYPLLGDKATGKAADWINALCVFGLVAGIGTSIGLGVDQITTGINFLTGLNLDTKFVSIFVCLTFAAISIIAASTGLHKGISIVSTANMYMYFVMMVFALFFGGTRFILNNTISSIGKYLSFFVGQSFYTEPAYQSGWVNGWTIFYWAWWLAYAPLVGLFMVKMAKGRTIREYVIVNLIGPTLFLILWFGIFGSSVINMELTGNTAVSEAYVAYGSSVALFAYLKELPLVPVLLVIGSLAVVFSILTLTEAEVMTLSDLCVVKKGEEKEATSDSHSPFSLKAFWGIAMCLLGFVLLQSGGLSAVQTSSIILGLPILILLLFMAVSLVKGLSKYKDYDTTLKEGEDYE